MGPENIEGYKVRLTQLLGTITDEPIVGLFQAGLNALDKPSQQQVVTSALQKIKNQLKDRNYQNRDRLIDIAIEFARLIYDAYNSNHYYLQKYCEFLLLKKGQENEVIMAIVEFFRRIQKESLDRGTVDFLTITLASAYAHIGNNAQAIIELEALNSSSTKVLDSLARLYYYNNEPRKGIDLLKEQLHMNEPMAFWLAKCYFSVEQLDNAVKVLQPFKGHDRVDKFLTQITVGYKRAVEGVSDSNKPSVFIVYGHDETTLERVELLLRRMDVIPIHFKNIQHKGSKTNIEILEKSIPKADAILVIMSPDDEGRKIGSEDSLKPRTRQNVLIEAGYPVISKRDRSVLLTLGVGDDFVPSDFAGINRVHGSEWSTDIELQIATRFKNMGINVDVGDIKGRT